MNINPASQSLNEARITAGQNGRVLLLSMRRIHKVVAYCMNYEFEDVIAQVTGADRVDAGDFAALDLSRGRYKAARTLTGLPGLARCIAPQPSAVRLERDYELFFPVFNNAHELYALASVPNWRERCRLAACFINEASRQALPRYLLELLREFDHIFLGILGPLQDIARIVGRPCTYLGSGVDAIRFAPLPRSVGRPIDVCNIGRRSQITHEALLKLSASGEIFYYFDTVAASGFKWKQRTFLVHDAAEHRLMFASLVKRSRYYIANRARINEPEYNSGLDEIAGRFYEGAAAGTVMLGEPPDADHFRKQFDWPDAVIHMPFDSIDVGRLIVELDRDSQRLARIRSQNVHNAALRHDWVHRFRTVLQTLDLEPPPAVLARERRLRSLANEALKQESEQCL